jgi:hypothetical protein
MYRLQEICFRPCTIQQTKQFGLNLSHRIIVASQGVIDSTLYLRARRV